MLARNIAEAIPISRKITKFKGHIYHEMSGDKLEGMSRWSSRWSLKQLKL